tara:strand:- start:2313 stop:3113 length:801 start_codon:yes stop_codon:yes gene_type:complete
MTELEFACSAVRQCGDRALSLFGNTDLAVYEKEDGSDVCTADIEVDGLGRAILGRGQHGDPVLSEETFKDISQLDQFIDLGSYWILDSIDGSTNYIHGIGHFCIALGKMREGRPVLGVVYDPVRGDLFAASEDTGATLNGDRISVSDTNTVAGTLIGYDWQNQTEEDNQRGFEGLRRLTSAGASTRKMASAALDICYVAVGRFGAYVCPSKGSFNPWDHVGPGYILEKAGGKFTNFQGEKANMFLQDRLASNWIIHDNLLEVVKDL